MHGTPARALDARPARRLVSFLFFFVPAARARPATVALAAAVLLASSLAPAAHAAADPVADEPAPEPEPAPPAEPASGAAAEPERRSVLTEQVVVTATGVATPAGEVASSISVVTREELERRQERSIADALRLVPGLDVRTSGPPGSVSSVFLRGADSDHTLLLVDGVEMNDPSSPNRLPFLDHLTPDLVERIEVLRGPQSTLYGSDAIGGVVQVFTEHGEGPPSGGLWTEGGSYATLRGGLRSSGAGERFDYAVSASASDSDGFSASASGVEDDPYRNATLAGRFGVNREGRAGLDAVVRHVEAEIGFDGFAAEEDQSIDSRQTVARLEPHLRSAGGRWEQRLGLRLARHRRDTRGSSPSLYEGRLSAVEWRNDVQLAGGQALALGLAGQWEEADLDGADEDARTLAAYVQDQVSRGRWSGTAGLRLDDQSEFGSEATYRLGVGRRFPERGITLRASAGTGYKAPSLSELAGSAFVVPNPDLDPEHSRGLDVGVERRGSRLGLGLTYFHNRIDDLIVAVCDATFTCRNFNVDEAETQGAELWAAGEPGADVTLRASYTYTGTEAQDAPASFGLTDGSSLLRRPRNKAGLDAHRRFDAAGVDLTLDVLYVGERRDIDPTTFEPMRADPYTVAGLAAAWEASGRVRLFGRIENLFDEDYEDVAGFATADRSGYAGLSVDW
jgi:vitamin B12 transporter